jgi:hypothetical protein
MGGSNTKDNMVFLTAREHYICHKLLIKFVDEKFRAKMIYAWHMMSINKSSRKLHITSHDYELLRTQFSIEIAKMNSGSSHPMFGKNHRTESKEKMSKSRKGKQTWMKGKKHTTETKIEMSISRSGKNNPIFGKFGSDNPNFGTHRNLQTKQKMSLAQKDRKFSYTHKQKLSTAKIKKLKFKAISLDGIKIISDIPRQFAKEHDLNIAHVFNCLYGRRKSHKGWMFEKLENEN